MVDINKGEECRSRLVVARVQNVKQIGCVFTATPPRHKANCGATPPLEVFRSLLICATIEELPNDVGQRMSHGRHVTFTVDPESGWRLGHVHTDRQSFLPFVPFTNSTSAGHSDPH